MFKPTESHQNPPKTGPVAAPGRHGDAPGGPGLALEALDLVVDSWQPDQKGSKSAFLGIF